MGKWERKIKKQMKKDAKKFETWYEENQNALEKVIGNSKNTFEESNGNTLKRTAIIWLPFSAIFISIVIFLTLIFLLTPNRDFNDFTFGDDSVYTEQLSDEEFKIVAETYPFVTGMQIVTKEKLKLFEDGSTVMALIYGELETEDNFYFIDIQIEYNTNYYFTSKPVYLELEGEVQIDNWKVAYKQTSIDPEGLYVYLIRLKSENNQMIYIETHCFEDDISYLLNEFI